MNGLAQFAYVVDRRLMAVHRPIQRALVSLAVAVIVASALTNVPRAFVDYSGVPLLERIHQYAQYGTDTIADMYESRVILHDVGDMYTKSETPQTPLEAETWSKAASSPYPPAALLAMAAVFAVGERTGAGFYGVMFGIGVLFLAFSAVYALRTRWYIFPLAWLNVVFLTRRFFYVADDSYLLMLLVCLAALLLARARRPGAHLLMAVATIMKLSPLYYVKHLPRMKRATAVAFVAILVAGLVLPYFIWPNYLYIFFFHEQTRSGTWAGRIVAAAFVAMFTLVLAYVETRLDFDDEDRIGWGLVPFAMFLALGMNAARNLLVVLLLPDKRVLRNMAGAFGLGLYWLLPRRPPFGAVTYFLIVFLSGALAYYLSRIGWEALVDDLRHPQRTLRIILGRPLSSAELAVLQPTADVHRDTY